MIQPQPRLDGPSGGTYGSTLYVLEPQSRTPSHVLVPTDLSAAAAPHTWDNLFQELCLHTLKWAKQGAGSSIGAAAD